MEKKDDTKLIIIMRSWIFWLAMLLLVLSIFLTFIDMVYGETQTTNITIQSSNGICTVTAPNYVFSADAQSNITTSFIVSHNFTNTTINYNVINNLSLIDPSELVSMNFTCPNNISVDNLSSFFVSQRETLKGDLAEYINIKLLPAQTQFDNLQNEIVTKNSIIQNMTLENNLTQVQLNNAQYQLDQAVRERDRAWYFFFAVLAILVIMFVAFSGIIKWNKPKME